MKRREPTGEADTGEATAEQAIPEPPHPVLALQGMVGNRATSRAIARRRSADGGIPQHAGLDIAPILAAQIPELLPLIKADDIQKMQHAYDAAQNNAILDQHVREKKADMLAHGIQDSGSEESRAMIASVPGQYESEQGPMFFEVETKDVLSEDILQEQPRNRAAEKAFRKWMYDDLMKAAKVHIKIEANARSAVAGGGIGHDAELYSGGRSLPHTRGKVHFQDLVESSYFKQAYYDRVTHSPELEELKKATHDVFVGVEEMKSEHLERIVLNGEHPVVRRVAEFLGGPGMKEEVEFMLDIIQHPEKGSFADRQDELSTVCPDLSIWEAPTNEAKATLEKLENQDIEMGLLYYMRAEKSFERAARQYQRYEDRVMSGAGLAVKWLNRAKFAGKLAAAAIPGGGVIDAAMMSAVYALAQEGGQQASEVAYGQRSSIDFGGLAKMAATEGAMAFFGGLTQEAFKAALTARVVEKWGAEALASSGTKIMISGTAATASSFYNVGANLALQKIVNGKANMPQDLNGLADLVLDEASSALLTDVGMQGVHMAGEHMETGSKTGEGKPRHEIEEHEQSGKPVEPSGSQHEEQRGGGIGGGGGGGTDPTGGKPPAPKKPAAVELAESAHTSPAAADALIAHYDGRWEDAIHALKKGTGDLSQMSPEARGKVIDTLLQHRQSFLNEIGKKFGAEPKGEPTASGEPESDVDLNMKGDEAGLKVAQATLFLDQAHPGWRTRFRMGLLVDAGRATSIGAHIAELPQHLQNEINQHHTLSSEAALVAREARHAPADAREAIISKIPDPTMREMARAMANATPEEIVDMRTTWLVDADRAFQRLSDTATPAEKARMINEAQDRQMLANSLDDGAYVTGGAIRSVVKGQSPQTAHDSYQTLIDQIAQIGIHAHEKGGMRAGLRDYETFKYIQRIATALEASGVHGDPRIRYLHQQAELVYNVERDAVASEDPRNLTRADLTTKTRHEDPNKRPQMYLSDYDSAGVSESHLEDIYAMTRQVIEDHMPSLRKTALGGDTAAGIPMPVELPPLEPRSPAPAPGPQEAGGGGGPGGGGSTGGGGSGGGTPAGTPAGSATPDRPVGNRDQTPAGPTATDRTDPTSKLDAETTQLSHHWKEVPAPPGISAGRNKLVFLQDPTNPTELWIFKPAKGEQELTFGPSVGIEAQERWRRAEAASRLGKDLGFDTPDVHLVDWKGEKGSLQRYRPGFETGDALATRNPDAWKKFWESQSRKDMDVFDFFIANQDRHGENWMIRMEGEDPKLMLIDQDSSIPADSRRNYEAQEPGRGHSQKWVRDLPPTVSKQVADKLRGLSERFPEQELQQWLTQPEIDGLRSRLGVLLTKIDSGAIRVVP